VARHNQANVVPFQTQCCALAKTIGGQNNSLIGPAAVRVIMQ
jgi:hypothetical protein